MESAIGGFYDIASQRKVAAASSSHTVNGRNGWLGQAMKPEGRQKCLARELLPRDRTVAKPFRLFATTAEIRSSAERAAAAREYAHPILWIRRNFVETLRQLAEEFRRERVHDFWTIERNRGNTRFARQHNRIRFMRAHGGRSSKAS